MYEFREYLIKSSQRNCMSFTINRERGTLGTPTSYTGTMNHSTVLKLRDYYIIIIAAWYRTVYCIAGFFRGL